jgi:hypothetical protein
MSPVVLFKHHGKAFGSGHSASALRSAGIDGKGGHLARTADRLGCQALAAATRHQPWSNHVPAGEIFKYPLAQSPS